MKNTLLKLSIEDGSINVSTLRKLLSYLNSKENLINTNIFKLSSDREFTNNFPSIIFGGNFNEAVIKAYGNFASKVLEENTSQIVSMLESHFQKEVTYSQEEFTLTANELDQESSTKNYYVRSIVLQDIGDKYPREVIQELKEGKKSDFIIKKLQYLIVKTLKEQSRVAKVETPFITVTNIDFAESVPVKTKDDVYQLALKDITFDLNVDLSNHWYVGLLRSRGFGELELTNPKLVSE